MNKYSILFAGIAISQAVAGYSANKPNIIFILTDDIGYGDFGCYGAHLIKTPNIDRLAREGVRFTQAYAPASTCTPTRYSLLTGEYAWRVKAGILPGDAPLIIDNQKQTLPKMLKNQGYQTAVIGKWHLGLGKKDEPVDFNKTVTNGPESVGFDYSYIYPATNDRVPCVYIENGRVENPDPRDPILISYRKKVGTDPTGLENPEMQKLKRHIGHSGTIVDGISRIGWMSGGKSARWKDEEMTDHLMRKVFAYIDQPHNQPFFLYYAPQIAHEPRVPSPRFAGKSSAGIYGDVIEELDDCIGKLISKLKESKQLDNTLIILTSDNGPTIKEAYDDGALEHMNGHDPYGGLRGEKGTLYEGGLRVPFIVYWPEKVKKSFVQQQPFNFLDMAATLASITGKAESINDSRDGSALFLEENAPVYRPLIILQNNGGDKAFRYGDWKWIPSRQELFNLKTDRAEMHDQTTAYPEILNQIKKLAKDFL